MRFGSRREWSVVSRIAIMAVCFGAACVGAPAALADTLPPGLQAWPDARFATPPPSGNPPAQIGVSAVAAPKFTCYNGTAFASMHNDHYVAGERGYTGGYYGMLRARTLANKIGYWEYWNFCLDHNTGLWSISESASPFKWTSAELGYSDGDNGMLRARASTVGPWERYQIICLNNSGNFAIRSKANGRYVSTEFGYTGERYEMLRARATVVGGWENYYYFPGCF